MNEIALNSTIYSFSIDFGTIDTRNVLDIYKYMIENLTQNDFGLKRFVFVLILSFGKTLVTKEDKMHISK